MAEGGLNRVSRDVDVILVFPIGERRDVGKRSTPARLETSNSYERRLRVLKRLHAIGLELTQSLSLDQTQWIIRISAPGELLERTAERMGKKFKTKLKNNSDDTNKGLLNGFAEFRREKKASVETQLAPGGTLQGRPIRNAGGVVRCGMRCRSRIDLRAWNGNGSFCT